MQNKGLVKFFAIIFAVLCVYQLTFTWVAGNVEKDAELYAKGDAQKEVKYLDSMAKVPVYPVLGYTYGEVREKQINKGLDLEGGVNVTLEISVREILKTLANNSENAVFNKALDEAAKQRQGNQDYLDAFWVAFAKESNGNVKLASPEIFGNINLASEITPTMTDEQVKKIITKKVSESIDSAYGVLTQRIDKFGVAQPNIMRMGESGRILVELPGVKDIERATKLLQSTAQLEFWDVYNAQEVMPYLNTINEALKNKGVDSTKTADAGKLLNAKDSVSKQDLGPLLGKLNSQMVSGGSPILGEATVEDAKIIDGYLNRPEFKKMLPNNLQFVRFAWGKEREADNKELVFLYALKTNRQNVPPLAGNAITSAEADFGQDGKPNVSMRMDPKGAQKWEEMTSKAARDRTNIAIVLDNVVYSAPSVSNAIAGGSSVISGDFDVTETTDLANILRSGKLPAKADIVEQQVVGPSLGEEAIHNGLLSSVAGFLLVCAWMWVYYGKAGTFANVALIINLLFMFGILASLGAVLTLPGIAGIVLTMGTAVDANIIIYERAKEELRQGKTLAEAIKTSFSWRGAMSSITDANVTHVLTGAVLFIFGSGLIKGFATTLLIGIFTSLFTSLFITRLFLDRAVTKNINLTFVTGLSKNWFTNFHFNFLGAKKFTYIFSSLVVIVSFTSFFVNGLDEGIDFAGGRTYTVRFDAPVDDEAVREELPALFDNQNVDVKRFGGDNQLRITTKYKIAFEGENVDKEVTTKLYNGLKKHYKNLSYEDFVNNNDTKTLGIVQSSVVKGSVAEDTKTNAYWAVLGAMAIVFIYLMVSFRKWQYSLGAIAAVAHDVIFVLGIYSLCYKFMPFHMEIDQHFIAAILTVIGYSMNDTVIVFDRVREFLAGNLKGSFKEVVNASINTTMSRTVNTSLTMIIVLAIMFVFGGESIRGFIFAMLTGIVVGTYSSLFIATPVLVDTVSRKDKEEIEKRHNENKDAA